MTVKPKIILLHGALGSQQQFEPLTKALENHFDVFTFDFEGHGKNQQEGVFSMQLFSENLRDFIHKNKLEKTNVFGYSMGGYVALTLAKSDPELLGKIVTLGTKFNWSPESAAEQIAMLDGEIIEKKIPTYAKSLARMHGEEKWKNLLKKTAAMMSDLGNGADLKPADFSQIRNNTLLLLGEYDKMVTLAETELVHIALRNAEMRILYDAKHPIESVNAEKLAKQIVKFII